MKDGNFLAVRAGCDYTGWDCQAGGSSNVARSEADIIRFGLSDNERARLNLKFIDDEPEVDKPPKMSKPFRFLDI
jgi:hypothetical protein